MGTTTFSGPVKAGNVREGASANVGFVSMSQTASITQASTTTNIVIPANSQIVSIRFIVTTAWNGAATTGGVGWTGTAAALTAATAAAGGTLGSKSLESGADATRAGNWKNVGSTDKTIIFTSTNTGAGEGVLTVEYVQAVNLT